MIMNIGATAFRHTIKFSKAFPPILKIRVKSKYTSKICKKQSGSYDRGNNTQLIFFGIVGFLALAALVGVVVYLRIDSKRSKDE